VFGRTAGVAAILATDEKDQRVLLVTRTVAGGGRVLAATGFKEQLVEKM